MNFLNDFVPKVEKVKLKYSESKEFRANKLKEHIQQQRDFFNNAWEQTKFSKLPENTKGLIQLKIMFYLQGQAKYWQEKRGENYIIESVRNIAMIISPKMNEQDSDDYWWTQPAYDFSWVAEVIKKFKKLFKIQEQKREDFIANRTRLGKKLHSGFRKWCKSIREITAIVSEFTIKKIKETTNLFIFRTSTYSEVMFNQSSANINDQVEVDESIDIWSDEIFD